MNITDRAMLVSLSVRGWSARKNDKRITREVATQHNSDESMGKYHKALISADALDALRKIERAARQEHYLRTLPWSEDGARILSSAGYLVYNEKMTEFRIKYEQAVSAFVTGYPAFVEDARRRLNGIFDENDYPSSERMARKFGFKIEIAPVPSADDFRVDLGSDETARIRREVEESAKEKLAYAMRDPWQRVHDAVSHMSERLHAYQVTPDGVQGMFRDTLVTNITELLDILPSLNLTSDPALDEVARQMRENLVSYDPETLRDSPPIRNAVAIAADSILARMGEYFDAVAA